jgi:hypothetical protein
MPVNLADRSGYLERVHEVERDKAVAVYVVAPGWPVGSENRLEPLVTARGALALIVNELGVGGLPAPAFPLVIVTMVDVDGAATTLPPASHIATYTVSELPFPTARLPVGQDAVAPELLVTYLSCVAGPVAMVKLALVAEVREVALAVSW